MVCSRNCFLQPTWPETNIYCIVQMTPFFEGARGNLSMFFRSLAFCGQALWHAAKAVTPLLHKTNDPLPKSVKPCQLAGLKHGTFRKKSQFRAIFEDVLIFYYRTYSGAVWIHGRGPHSLHIAIILSRQKYL